MVFLRFAGFPAIFCLMFLQVNGQVFQPRQKKLFRILPDTIVLDSLSLVPGSVKLRSFPSDSALLPSVDYKRHSLIFPARKPDSLYVTYQRFPYNFEKLFFHKDQNDLYTDMSRRQDPYTIRYGSSNRGNLLQNDGLNKNGSISRGISFGNNQDVVV